MASRYRIGPKDRPLAEEFRQTPIGHHSPALQRVLNVFRGEPMKGKYVLICTKPHKEWVLGRLSGERGRLIKLLKKKVYENIEDAEWDVFKLRWKKYTGSELT